MAGMRGRLVRPAAEKRVREGRHVDSHVANGQQYMDNVLAVKRLMDSRYSVDLVEAEIRITSMVAWLEAEAEYGVSEESGRAGEQATAWRDRLQEIKRRLAR
jgi:hypothetical protein